MIFSPHKTRNKPDLHHLSINDSLPCEPILPITSLLISHPDSLFNSPCFPEYHTTTISHTFQHFISTLPFKLPTQTTKNTLDLIHNDEEWYNMNLWPLIYFSRLKFLHCQFECQGNSFKETNMHGVSLEFDNLLKNDRNSWTHNRVTGSSEDRYFSLK